MDLSVLKKRSPFPFETIALAVAFSPRLEALLCETKRIASLYGSHLVLIHVGKKESEWEDKLDKLIAKTGISKIKHRVIWMEGEPVDTILRLCKLNVVDLLILGAIERENLFKYYVGSIARNISRRAKCSVLLLTTPSINPKKFAKIMVSGVDNPKTELTLQTVQYMAEKEKVKEFKVIREVDFPLLPGGANENEAESEVIQIKRQLFEEEQTRIVELVQRIAKEQVSITIEDVNGKAGYAISHHARKNNADLVVFNSPDVLLGLFDRIFTHDIEYVLADLPCNLLIVHSRL
jgi:nucleotide-binding universal stress UspA family protein